MNDPKRPSNRPVLGFGQNGPNPRTPRTPKAFVKKSVRGCFARGFCRKRTTLEHLERSGEFKGVREEGEVFEGMGGGGPSGKIKGLRYKARYGHRSVRNKETSMQQNLLT